jgi:hypothetical protein
MKETINKLLKRVGLVAIGVVLGVMLLRQCSPMPQPQTETIIKHKVDTIWAKDTTYKLVVKKIPVPKVVHDTIYKAAPLDSAICNRIHEYSDSLIDSNLVLNYKIYTQGILKDFKPSYKLKVPLRIIDSVWVLQRVEKNPIFALDGVVVVSRNTIAPMAYLSGKRTGVGVGYDMLNKTPVFSLKYNIFTKYKK